MANKSSRHARSTDTTVSLFMEAGRLVRRKIEGEPVPLSFAQCEALRHIANGSLTMRELATSLGIAAPSATALVAELARAKYVLREGNAHDRRQIILSATPRGRAAVDATLKSRARVLSQLLGGLSARDHSDMQRIFTKIISTIKN